MPALGRCPSAPTPSQEGRRRWCRRTGRSRAVALRSGSSMISGGVGRGTSRSSRDLPRVGHRGQLTCCHAHSSVVPRYVVTEHSGADSLPTGQTPSLRAGLPRFQTRSLCPLPVDSAGRRRRRRCWTGQRKGSDTVPEHTWRQAVVDYGDDIAKAARWPTSCWSRRDPSPLGRSRLSTARLLVVSIRAVGLAVCDWPA